MCHKCVTKVENAVFSALSVDSGEGFSCVKKGIKKAPHSIKSKALFPFLLVANQPSTVSQRELILVPNSM